MGDVFHIPTFGWWLIGYFAVGALLGELYLRGAQRDGSVRNLTYVLGVCLWPVALVVAAIRR